MFYNLKKKNLNFYCNRNIHLIGFLSFKNFCRIFGLFFFMKYYFFNKLSSKGNFKVMKKINQIKINPNPTAKLSFLVLDLTECDCKRKCKFCFNILACWN